MSCLGASLVELHTEKMLDHAPPQFRATRTLRAESLFFPAAIDHHMIIIILGGTLLIFMTPIALSFPT